MLKIGKNNNNLEFLLEVENTTLDQIQPRLIIEVDNKSTLIPLKVDKNGKVNSIIYLKEEWSGKVGNIKLEVINENNYFIPFESEVIFDSFKQKPKAIVKEINNTRNTPSPPQVTLKKTIQKPLLSEDLIENLTEDLTEDLTGDIQSFFKNL